MDQKRLLGGAEAIPVNQANYDGYAKGPDGRVYVLGDDSKWALSSFVPARLAGRPAFPAVQNGGGVESGQAAFDAEQAADRAADQGGRN